MVSPAPKPPLVDYNAIITEMMMAMRRARARVDAEKELAGQANKEKQERLKRVLSGIARPFAVP